MKDNSIFNPIEEYIHKLSDEIEIPTAFYPSNASCIVNGKVIGGWSACLRKQYYQWKGIKPTNKLVYRSWLAIRLGEAYEEAFLEAYEKAGLLKHKQFPFFVEIMGIPIAGRVDGITKDKEIIECKSAYGEAFYSSVANEPKIENLPQILVYMAVLGLNTAIVPYGSRDNTARRSGFRITKKEIEEKGIYFVKIIWRWKILQMCLETNILPPRDFNLFEDYQCSYCEYFLEGEDKRGCYSQKEIDEYFEMKKKKKS